MRIELDHLFVCTAPGAPAAEKLVQFGLHEGPPNQHPGQGTTCRRFAFANAMIELFWVSDASEAQNQSTRRTLLWERWSGREAQASPFGICLRPVDPQDTGPPFPAWEYRPAYLSDPLFMYIGEVGIEEPPLRSPVAQRIVESGVLSARTGATSLLEIEFDGNRRKEQVDFRPHLPFVFQL